LQLESLAYALCCSGSHTRHSRRHAGRNSLRAGSVLTDRTIIDDMTPDQFQALQRAAFIQGALATFALIFAHYAVMKDLERRIANAKAENDPRPSR